MVKFHASINPHGQVYLPCEIREELATKELDILGDAKAILLYPEGTNIEQLLGSLRILKFDLEHRLSIEKSRIKPETRTTSLVQRGRRT